MDTKHWCYFHSDAPARFVITQANDDNPEFLLCDACLDVFNAAIEFTGIHDEWILEDWLENQ